MSKTAIIMRVDGQNHQVILLEDGKTVQQVEARDEADAVRITEAWKSGTYKLLTE